MGNVPRWSASAFGISLGITVALGLLKWLAPLTRLRLHIVAILSTVIAPPFHHPTFLISPAAVAV